MQISPEWREPQTYPKQRYRWISKLSNLQNGECVHKEIEKNYTLQAEILMTSRVRECILFTSANLVLIQFSQASFLPKILLLGYCQGGKSGTIRSFLYFYLSLCSCLEPFLMRCLADTLGLVTHLKDFVPFQGGFCEIFMTLD